MTDFLTRLIGRNLGQWPVVQPQIASLYAPVPPLASLDGMTEDAVSSVASSPPVSVMDTPVNDPTPSFSPTAPDPVLDRPASIPSLFASSDRPTLPLTRLPRMIAPLPANQPSPLDSTAPAQQAPAPQPVPPSLEAVSISNPFERSGVSLNPDIPTLNLPVENSQPSTPQVRLAPDSAPTFPTAMPQTVVPRSPLSSAQTVATASSVDSANALTLPPPPVPAPSTPAILEGSTASAPLDSAAALQPLSVQPILPTRAVQSSFSEVPAAMAPEQNAGLPLPAVRPPDLLRQDLAIVSARPPGSTDPGESFPPVVAPLLPTVTPALVVTAPVAPPPQALRQGGSAAAPAVPTIHVTIGRIEVRAVTLPSPPPSRARRTPTAPQLSLNDYLTSRDQTP